MNKIKAKDKLRQITHSIDFWVIFALVLSTIIVFTLASKDRVVPVGPLIGGDTYAHIGAVKSISENWTPWIDQYYGDSIPRSYPWIWHFGMAILSFFMSYNMLFIWMPLVFWIISVIGIYYSGKILHGRNFGIFLALFYFFIFDNAMVNPNPKNLLFLSFFLSLAAIYYAIKSDKIVHSVIAGIILGLTFWNYTLLGSLFAVPFLFIILKKISGKYDSNKQIIIDLKKSGIMLLSGLLISAVYWVPVVLLGRGLGMEGQVIASGIKQYTGYPFFERLYSIIAMFISAKYFIFIPLFILGIIYMLQRKKDQDLIIISSIIIFILGIFHDYITKPLMNWSGVQPFYFPDFLRFAYPLVIITGFIVVINMLGRKIKADAEKYNLWVISISTIIILLVTLPTMYNFLTKDYAPWAEMSYKPIDPMFTEPAAWIEKNTNDNDVIIAHPFYAYGMFGLTGRHIYASMYGHMLSLYNDEERRDYAEQIYLTSNMTYALELLKKYNTTYLIIDPYVIDNNQWFQAYHWDVMTGKRTWTPQPRNLTKFLNSEHFTPVYQYTRNVNGQVMPVVMIFRINY